MVYLSTTDHSLVTQALRAECSEDVHDVQRTVCVAPADALEDEIHERCATLNDEIQTTLRARSETHPGPHG